jgi:hypothetical protein
MRGKVVELLSVDGQMIEMMSRQARQGLLNLIQVMRGDGNRNVFPDVSMRSCKTCGRYRGQTSGECDDLMDEELPGGAWNCWRPKGVILIWSERVA